MALEPIMELCAIIGAFIGVMIGTLGPYYKVKKQLGFDDVSIFFDKKFIKATIVSGILSAVAVGGAFPVILENVNPLWSYTSTIVFSATLALALNLGGNIILGPSLVTEAARQKVMEKEMSKLLDFQLKTATEKIQKELKKNQEEFVNKDLKNKVENMYLDAEGNWVEKPASEDIETTKKVEYKDEEPVNP